MPSLVYIAAPKSFTVISKERTKKHTPVIDEETAPVVVRIFEMYASG